MRLSFTTPTILLLVLSGYSMLKIRPCIISVDAGLGERKITRLFFTIIMAQCSPYLLDDLALVGGTRRDPALKRRPGQCPALCRKKSRLAIE